MADGFDFDDKWRMLRQRFITRLEERERNIQAAWTEVRACRDPEGTARSLLFHQIHSLSGSGATFGFAALSAAARVIEPLIDPAHVPHEQVQDARVLDAVGVALDHLISELRRINPGAST